MKNKQPHSAHKDFTMDQTQSRRGRPPRITHDQIAQAVIDVGFPNLTFAAVREKLGVGESTLYRYAPDRDELVRMGLNYAFSQVEMPPLEGHWRDILHSQAVHLWRSFEKYPGSARAMRRPNSPRVHPRKRCYCLRHPVRYGDRQQARSRAY